MAHRLTERFSSVSMQDPSQKLPSFRCFLPVELDDRASWHETRHRKGKNCLLLSLRKLSRFCFDGHFRMLPHAKQLWNADRKGTLLALNFSPFQAPSKETWIRSDVTNSQGKTNWFEDYNYIGSNKHRKNVFDKVMEDWKRCVNREHGVLDLKLASSASCFCFAPKFWSVCRLVEPSCVWLFSWF